MWVVEGVLEERDVLLLGDNLLLESFARCSRDAINERVLKYLKSPEGDEEVKSYLRSAYNEAITLDNVENQEELRNKIETVSSYTLEDVHAGLDIKSLEAIKNNILEVYNNEMDIPYKHVRKSSDVKMLVTNLTAMYKSTGNYDFKKIASMILANKVLFVDNVKFMRGTPLKGIFKNSEVLSILLKGIDFLIERKTEGAAPESWRIF